jgi:hypothetical protein
VAKNIARLAKSRGGGVNVWRVPGAFHLDVRRAHASQALLGRHHDVLGPLRRQAHQSHRGGVDGHRIATREDRVHPARRSVGRPTTLHANDGVHEDHLRLQHVLDRRQHRLDVPVVSQTVVAIGHASPLVLEGPLEVRESVGLRTGTLLKTSASSSRRGMAIVPTGSQGTGTVGDSEKLTSSTASFPAIST